MKYKIKAPNKHTTNTKTQGSAGAMIVVYLIRDGYELFVYANKEEAEKHSRACENEEHKRPTVWAKRVRQLYRKRADPPGGEDEA